MTRRWPFRYLGWMGRDFALGPGLAYLAIAALFAWISTRRDGPMTPDGALQMQQMVVAQFAWIVVLVATAGMVSTDLSRGFYRGLFTQPVNPALYYLQRWLVGGLAVGAFVPLVGLGLFIASGQFPFSAVLLVRLLLLYAMLGGVAFVFSATLRTDWLIALLVFILQGALHSLQAQGAKLGPVTLALAKGLPPFHLAAIGGAGLAYPATGDLIHILLYSAGLVALAVVLLVRRPLGSGGRA
jgi:hypothetical protein